VTRHGVWISKWIYWTLETATTINYSALANSHTLWITIARTKSTQFAFTSGCLATSPHNDVDSLASVSTSLPATDCLITAHGRNSWPHLATTGNHSLSQASTHFRLRTRLSRDLKSYFPTGGLPPIRLSWRQNPWGSRPEIFFFIEPLRS
jgi:hypothetical protein